MKHLNIGRNLATRNGSAQSVVAPPTMPTCMTRITSWINTSARSRQ